MSPPGIGVPRARWRNGWLSSLWVCRVLRTVAFDDPVVWALAYSQIPCKMKLFKVSFLHSWVVLGWALTAGKEYARCVPPLFILGKTWPRLSCSRRHSPYVNKDRLHPLFAKAALRDCCGIHLETYSGSAAHARHLLDLSRVEPLANLKDLTLWITDDSPMRSLVKCVDQYCEHSPVAHHKQ